MQPLFHSLQRDWASWTLIERIAAVALLAAPFLAALILTLPL